MSILMAALLGLIQGVTEFLPVSSSGHLAVLQSFFGLQNVEETDLLFDVLLHFATLVSICIVYRRDIADMIREFIGFFRDVRHPKPDDDVPKPARRLLFMIVIACLPLIVVLPFQDAIASLSSNTIFIGIMFLVTGGILFFSDRLRQGHKTETSMTVGNTLIIGAAQVLGTLPGISRSGVTITAGMATGLDRNFAVKFSFLLSLPAVLAATLVTLYKALLGGIDVSRIPAYLVGMVVAGVTGYFAISLVKKITAKGKFGKFSYYMFAVGVLTIILSFIL